MNFTQINERIKQYEEALKTGEMDMTEATSLVKEALDDYTATDDAIVHFKDYKVPEGLGRNHIPSNIPELDEMIGGFGKGDLQLIIGDTSDGKTTFARFLIRKFTEQDRKSLVFSYEETNEEFLSKFVGELPDGYIPKVLTTKSLVWIEAKILESKELYGTEIIFIDNLAAIIDHESRRNEVGEVDRIVQTLKAIAIKHNVVIFLLAHPKKSDTGLIDRNSVSGSKMTVNTASIAIALWRNRDKQTKKELEEFGIKYNNYCNFYLVKNRYKSIYNHFTMLFHPDKGIYTSRPQDTIVSEEDIKIDFN